MTPRKSWEEVEENVYKCVDIEEKENTNIDDDIIENGECIDFDDDIIDESWYDGDDLDHYTGEVIRYKRKSRDKYGYWDYWVYPDEDGELVMERHMRREANKPQPKKYNFPHAYSIGEYIRWVDSIEAIDYVVEQYGHGSTKEGISHWDSVENRDFKIIDIQRPIGGGVYYVTQDDNGMIEKIPEKFATFVF